MPKQTSHQKQETVKPKVQTSQELISRDEMNLAEFPFAALSERIPKEVKSLIFTDEIKGEGGKLVKRTWTITGSDKYGLPRGKDIDVLQALLKISRDNNFSDPTNHFTLSEVIRIMDWKDKGRNYKRVEEALARLLRTTISAENAFWDNERKVFLTVGFNILDSFELWKTKEKRGPRPTNQSRLPLSNFTWGKVVFRSFKRGYLKPIDLGLFYGLKSNISKRLFQYLDKKKYKKLRFEIDLFLLSFEKLGLSKSYYLSDIKRKLERAHQELIDARFLRSAEYKLTADGKSQKVVYCFVTKSQRGKEKVKQEPTSTFVDALAEIGVEQETAKELVRKYPEELIRKQLRALDYRRVDKSRTGALIKSIEEDWSLPEEMVKADKANQQKATDKARQDAEQKTAELCRLHKEYLDAEVEKLMMGSRREDYERIVREEEKEVLKNSPKNQIKGSTILEEMLNSFVIRRLESEGYLLSFEDWKSKKLLD